MQIHESYRDYSISSVDRYKVGERRERERGWGWVGGGTQETNVLMTPNRTGQERIIIYSHERGKRNLSLMVFFIYTYI